VHIPQALFATPHHARRTHEVGERGLSQSTGFLGQSVQRTLHHSILGPPRHPNPNASELIARTVTRLPAPWITGETVVDTDEIALARRDLHPRCETWPKEERVLDRRTARRTALAVFAVNRAVYLRRPGGTGVLEGQVGTTPTVTGALLPTKPRQRVVDASKERGGLSPGTAPTFLGGQLAW
jgi:hypothetical protein